MRRVVITGAGTINALGQTVSQTYEAFAQGRCGIGILDIQDLERLSIRIGGQVRDWPTEGVFNRQEIALYDRFTQFAVQAAHQAVAASGLIFEDQLSLTSGVVLGTAGGGVNTWDENYRTVYEEGQEPGSSFCGAKVDE